MTEFDIELRKRARNHPSLATLNGDRRPPVIDVGRFRPAPRCGAVLGHVGVALPKSDVRLRVKLSLGSDGQIRVALPQRASGLRIASELAGEIKREVMQTVEASAGFGRCLAEASIRRVRQARAAVDRLRQLPLFESPGCGDHLATVRGALDEMLVSLPVGRR